MWEEQGDMAPGHHSLGRYIFVFFFLGLLVTNVPILIQLAFSQSSC